jgi:hypothetical protein
MSKLVSEGHIRICKPIARRGIRMVTVMASGRSTGVTEPGYNTEYSPPWVEREINWPDYGPHNLRFK